MSASKEYKAARNCILNELHLTKEDTMRGYCERFSAKILPVLQQAIKDDLANN